MSDKTTVSRDPDTGFARIDRIEDVKADDIVVTTSGNRYKAGYAVTGYGVTAHADGIVCVISPSHFSHALRPASQLPDKPGVYRSADGRPYLFDGEALQPLIDRCGDWCTELPALNAQEGAGHLAPFTPYTPKETDE